MGKLQAIGNALDRWELLSNDVRSYIKEQEPEFYRAMNDLYHTFEHPEPEAALKQEQELSGSSKIAGVEDRVYDHSDPWAGMTVKDVLESRTSKEDWNTTGNPVPWKDPYWG